ncbi:MAG: hypothetical protein DWQ04_18265 [Chloroflexi bacterium]|nr:MAG: hypothetical protein DWQ04_18265 [Chloroflexota bacterium]
MKVVTIWNWIDALVVALCLVTLGSLFTAVSVNAHAYLAESIPRNGELLREPPTQVVTYFTEELETSSTIAVLDENGNQVDNGDGSVDLYDPEHKSMIVTLPENLPEGQYVVEWAVLSAEDGDPTDGAFLFSIGETISTANRATPFKSTQSDQGSIGWWVGGGIGALILVLLISMLLLTRQPIMHLE